MKRKPSLFLKSFLWILLFNLISCTEIDLTHISKDIKLQESLILPLVKDSITVGQFLDKLDLKNDLIGYNADTVFFQAEAQKEFKFADVNLLKNAVSKVLSLSLTSGTVAANQAVSAPGALNQQINMGFDPFSVTVRVDSVKSNILSLAVKVSVTDIKNQSGNPILPSDLKIRLKFPTMHYQINYLPIQTDFSVTQFGTDAAVVLNNLMIQTAGMSSLPFDMQFFAGSNPITLGSNAKISVEIKATQIDNSVVYGIFEPSALGDNLLKIPQEDLKDLPTGMKFANPQAFVSFESNFGTYLRLKVESLRAYNKTTQQKGQFKDKTGVYRDTTSVWLKDRAKIPGSTVNFRMPTLNNVYGQTDLLFDTSSKFDSLEYKFSLTVDHESNKLVDQHLAPLYAIPGSKLSAQIRFQVPFYLKANSNFDYSDSLSINNVFNKLKRSSLLLKITNGLPMNITYSLKFLDSKKSEILVPTINSKTYEIKSANADAVTGLYVSGTQSDLTIDFSENETSQLANAEKMIVNLKFTGQPTSSTTSKSIQITKKNYFKIKAGVLLKGDYLFNPDSILDFKFNFNFN
jgi:hypothetical protein